MPFWGAPTGSAVAVRRCGNAGGNTITTPQLTLSGVQGGHYSWATVVCHSFPHRRHHSGSGIKPSPARSVSGPAIVMTVAVVVSLCTLFTVNRHCWALNRVVHSKCMDGWRDCRRCGLSDYHGGLSLLNRHAAVQSFELHRQLAAGMTIGR